MTELEELKALAAENGENYFGIDDLPEDWDEIDDGNWTDEGKYSYMTRIVAKNGKFFAIDQSRSGSYFSDYYYTTAEVYEVARKEIVTTVVKWEPV